MIPVLKRIKGSRSGARDYHLPHETQPERALCGAPTSGEYWESVQMDALPGETQGGCWHCLRIARAASKPVEPTRQDQERARMAEWNSGQPIRSTR